MRPTAHVTMHHIGKTENVKMGIAQEAMAHIMSVLTDLYSDPIKAVIREYSTNALDSNIAAGNPNPIEVTLPTPTHPTFVVKDQGLGLSLEEIREVYSMYGSSTKRDSDDVTGMLGLGSKSGLTYAIQFTVDAVKDGRRTAALVTKDNDGSGVIKILDTSDTDTRNGVTVSIPVKLYDLALFDRAAKALYQFWEPGTVLLDGEEPKMYRHTTNGTEGVWLSEDVLALPDRQEQSHVVMGSVGYPVRSHKSFIAYVPMGSVHFAPSREDLMLTDHTNQTLALLEEYISDNAPRVMDDAATQQKTAWDRCKFNQAWFNNPLGWRRKDINFNVSFRGKRAFLYNLTSNVAEGYTDYLRLHSFHNEDMVIFTGYPSKSVTLKARAAIQNFCQSLESESRAVWVLPEGADISMLEGRPNVYDWDSVPVPAQAEQKKSTAARTTEVVYPYCKDGVGYTSDETPLGDAELVYCLKAVIPFTDKLGDNTVLSVKGASQLFPDYAFVMIGRNQTDKLLRTYPKAINYQVLVAQARNKAVEELTEYDLAEEHLTYADRAIAGLVRKCGALNDPDLNEVRKIGDSPKLQYARNLKATIPLPKVMSDVFVRVVDRYPLIEPLRIATFSTVCFEELTWYLNSRYASLVTQAQTAA